MWGERERGRERERKRGREREGEREGKRDKCTCTHKLVLSQKIKIARLQL